MAEQIKILAVYDNAAFAGQIEYTFELICSIYGISFRTVSLEKFRSEKIDLTGVIGITYGKELIKAAFERQIHVYASDFFGVDYLKPASMPVTPLKKHGDLPVIYAGAGKLNGWVQQSPSLIQTNIDIIASGFFMVSRYEEVVVETRDVHDRFPAAASLAYREGFLDRPIVNEYMEFLWELLQSLAPQLARKPLWPDDKEFAFCLTHDVDFIRRFKLRPPVFTFLKAIRGQGVRAGVRVIGEYLAALISYKNDPFNTFDYLANQNQKYGLKSSFYFMTKNANYNVRSAKALNIIQQLKSLNYEIGLHGSFDSYNDKEQLSLERKIIDDIAGTGVYGTRQHYLRWKTPDTWRIQADLHLLYDTTLSFADHAGFRCGICTPFKPYDVLANQKLDIWELPLIVMEGSLQGANYQNLPAETAYQEIIKLIQTVRKYRGLFVLLWHNSSFNPSDGWEGWQEVYERVLAHIHRQSPWNATGRNIVNWWGQAQSERPTNKS